MLQVATDISSKLETTIRNFLENGVMFTAYDVTIETRVREKMFLRHQDVNGVCHDLDVLTDALNFGYENNKNETLKWVRTKRDIPSNPGAWAWIYHPENLDPNSYQFRNQKNSISSAPTQVVSSTNVSGGIQSDGTSGAASVYSTNVKGTLFFKTHDGIYGQSPLKSDSTFAVDNRNRLLIPTRFLRDIGINSGEKCRVLSDPKNKIVMIVRMFTSNSLSLNFNVNCQKVEKNGELRLSSKTLHSAGLIKTKFKVSVFKYNFDSKAENVIVVE